MRVLAAIGLAAAMAACATADPVPTLSSKVAVNALSWNGEVFKAGDRVVITHKAGTFKPTDTGYEEQVTAEAGKTGMVLGGMIRPPPLPWIEVDPRERIQVALVRWDAQPWNNETATVELGEFEATIHAEYLDVVKQ